MPIAERNGPGRGWDAETVFSDDPFDEIRGEPWLSERLRGLKGGALRLQDFADVVKRGGGADIAAQDGEVFVA